MTLPLVVLKPKKEISIHRKHHWVFSGAIDAVSEEIQNGDLVWVTNHKQEVIATGLFQEFGSISVRVLAFEKAEITQDWWNIKIKSAVSARISLGLFSKTNNIIRLVFGEGDGLPGLVIDYYNKTTVIQCHTNGMLQFLDNISVALQHALGSKLKHVYNKSEGAIKFETETKDGTLWGEPQESTVALENGAKYNIDWVNGQKTGFFIDQRDNRSLLMQYSKGKTVLNTFCYSGGFSIAALQGGAKKVVSLDSSVGALTLTEQNVTLNKFEGKQHETVQADAVDYIKDIGNSYDIIILDPPAFAKNKSARHKAVQAYKRINLHALRQIKNGGILFTFSCSQAVDKQLFSNTVIAAAIESGREVKILHQLHQPADHPVNAYHPEGEYLKGLVLYIN